MDIREGFISAIGKTPLIRLQQASAATGCNILAKAEFTNPGGSVKDRAALWIVRDAETKGELKPGGVIVEGTAGNTGIGLTLVGNALGYRSVIVMPETQSREKKDLLRLIGADLRLVPAKPYSDPMNYVRYSERLAGEIAEKEANGAIWANQFDNVANRQAHYEGTGPEIWDQTDGHIDAFTCSVGTGGTIAGVALALGRRCGPTVLARLFARRWPDVARRWPGDALARRWPARFVCALSRAQTVSIVGRWYRKARGSALSPPRARASGRAKEANAISTPCLARC